MTLAKRLLLGTAAAFVATSGAHAADLGLPVAPSVDYVQICTIGSFTGFLLPGGDVCFDISGYARGQLTWTEEIDPWSYPTTLATDVDATLTSNGLSAATIHQTVSARAAVAAAAAVDPTWLIYDTGADQTTQADDVVTVVQQAATPATPGNAGSTVQQIDAGTAAVTAVTALPYYYQLTNAGIAASGFMSLGANTANTNIGFADNDAITGLGVLNVAGDNDELAFLGNARLNFDARTMTEYGLLRGFIRLDGENGGAANVDRAFVQLNVGSLGFTAGLASSVFDPVFTGYGSGAAQGLGLADEANVQFSVNASLGNGVTVSLSVEDDDGRTGDILTLTESDRTPDANDADAGGLWTLATGAYDGGASVPDLVAAIRVDQAWGSAKLAAAMHEVNPAGSAFESEFGYAISGSAEFNIPVGVGSTFGVTGIYAHGAQQFMGFNNEVGNSATGFADALLVTTVTGPDAGPIVTTRSTELTTSYVIAAGFNFGVSDMVALSLDGSYADVDHFGELFDGNVWTVRGGVAYTPVNNLTINAHVSYAASDFNTSALRTSVDEDEWGARFRVTRSF